MLSGYKFKQAIVIEIEIRVRDCSGALFLNCTAFKGGAIQKKAGTKSPTRSFYVGSRQNKTTFSSISKKSISLANQKKLKQYARQQRRTF